MNTIWHWTVHDSEDFYFPVFIAFGALDSLSNWMCKGTDQSFLCKQDNLSGATFKKQPNRNLSGATFNKQPNRPSRKMSQDVGASNCQGAKNCKKCKSPLKVKIAGMVCIVQIVCIVCVVQILCIVRLQRALDGAKTPGAKLCKTGKAIWRQFVQASKASQHFTMLHMMTFISVHQWKWQWHWQSRAAPWPR